jgi:hypothetical protein
MQGTTWLELLLFFRIRGGKVVRQQFPGESHILPKFAFLFKAFIRPSKALLEFAAPHSRRLITPVLTRARSLKQYGMTTFMAMISARIAIRDDAARGLHRALCAIGGGITSATAMPSKLRLGFFRPQQHFPWGKPKVDEALMAAARRRVAAEEPAPEAPRIGFPEKPATLSLTCIRSSARREARSTWLYRHGKPCTLKCKHCQCTSSARRWLCPCGTSWIACARHRQLGFLCRGGARVTAKAKGSDCSRPPAPHPKRRKVAGSYTRIMSIQPSSSSNGIIPLFPALPLPPAVAAVVVAVVVAVATGLLNR